MVAEAGRGAEVRFAGTAYQRQPPSPIAEATSAGTASSPMPAYAVRQSGLMAFSIPSFDFYSGGGTGSGNGSTPREPEPSFAMARTARFFAASRSIRGVSPGSVDGVSTSRRGLKMSSLASGVPWRSAGPGRVGASCGAAAGGAARSPGRSVSRVGARGEGTAEGAVPGCGSTAGVDAGDGTLTGGAI